MKAIIMAGGEGSRLRPLTCDRPKPMVPVGNKPVMEYAVQLLKTHGITEIGVTLQYLPEAIKEYFGDGEDFGVNLSYFVEETPLGTAGSVKNATAFLDDTFIVVSGDALTDLDLSEAVAFHREKGAVATLVLTTVENPLEYGVVITNTDNTIRRFLEKPSWGEVFSDRVNTGIYVLDPAVLKLIPDGQMFDFSKDLFPLLLAGNKPLYGVTLSGYWCDIGNLQQYRQAHHDLLSGQVKVPEASFVGTSNIMIGSGSKVDPSARLDGPIWIGDYCDIGPDTTITPFTVLGNRVIVEKGVSIKRSVVWDNAYIGKNSALRGAVIGREVLIRANNTIYEGAVIGDGTRLGERCIVKPDVKIWPCKYVDRSTTVDSSLVWGTHSCRTLFGKEGVFGLANIDITPEMAARLGAAYGSILPEGGRVALSSDSSTTSQMLKHALAAGLQSTGITVLELGDMVTPVHRFSVPSLEVKGGIHVKRDTRDREKVCLHMMESDGSDMSPGVTRKIENVFWREDVRRVKGTGTGGINYVPNSAGVYRDRLLEAVDIKGIKEHRFHLVVDQHAPFLTELMEPLWEDLECGIDPFRVSIGEGERNFTEMRSMLPHLAREVVRHSADLGLMIDHNGEQLALIDDQGHILEESELTALICLLILQSNNGGTIAMPVTAPSAVDDLAREYGGRVLRTKTAPYAVMDAARQSDVKVTQLHCQQIGLQFDAIQAVTRLLDFLASRRAKLSEVVSGLPSSYLSSGEVDCPWYEKSRVMRTLIESEGTGEVELLDGIKVLKDNGWALVLPDAEEPLCRVYSEGFSQEIANELTNFYMDKINQILVRDE